MQIRKSMPFFWPKLVIQGFFVGALASGCAAGGGGLEDGSSSDFAPSAPLAPSAPIAPSAPSAGNAAPAGSSGSGTGSSTTSPVSAGPAADAPDNAGSEVQPVPQREEDADPGAEEPGAEQPGANNPPPNPRGDDDDDDDDRDRDDDDDSDSDDDDDDGRDDDGGDGDDGGDDDDDGDGDGDGDDGGGTGVTPPPDPGNPPPSAGEVTFTDDIRPILLANCGRCHASGGLPQFASANAATGYDVAFRERNEIISEIRSGSMPEDTCDGPPGSNGCVSAADFALIQQWVAAGAPE